MTTTPPLPPRPKAASIFMAVPVVFLGFLGLSFLVLWVITRFGEPSADGESVEITFSGACLDEAAPYLTERAQQVGMTAQMANGTMRTTLPDIENARSIVPAMLTTTGALMVTADGFQVGNDGIADVAINLDKAGMPETLIKFNADIRAAIKALEDNTQLQPSIDGQVLPDVRASDVKEEGVLALHSGDGKTSIRMQRAADRAIVLAHGPLPCPIQVESVRATSPQ